MKVDTEGRVTRSTHQFLPEHAYAVEGVIALYILYGDSSGITLDYSSQVGLRDC